MSVWQLALGAPISDPVVRASIGSDHGPGPLEVKARTLNLYKEPGNRFCTSVFVRGLTPSLVPSFQLSSP